MKNRIGLSVCSVALMISAGTVSAADLLIAPPPPPPPPIEVYPERTSCFYVRGDVGPGLYERPDLLKNLPGGVVQDVTDDKLDPTYVSDIGVGCEFDYNLRADLTLGYRGKSDLTGNSGGPIAMSFSATTVMANVYYDIGNFYGFVPYVGVGIGVARHKISDVKSPALTVPGVSTKFAYALHAGVSYDIDESLAVDASYRYINLGDGRSGDSLDIISYSDVIGHDARIGLRYRFLD